MSFRLTEIPQLPAETEEAVRVVYVSTLEHLTALDVVNRSLFQVSFRPPERPRVPDIAFADGTHWNPGSGPGFYYYGADAAWHVMGLPAGAGGQMQTPWLSNINAAGFRLDNAGGVGIGKVPTFPLDVIGDCNITGTYYVSGVPLALGKQQTPWAQTVNAASYGLHSVYSVSIGSVQTTRPGVALSVISAVYPAGMAGAKQIAICESGAGANGYQMEIGYTVINSAYWAGVIQVLSGGGSAPLFLNPLGGAISVNKATAGSYALDIVGDCNVTGVFRVNGVPLVTGGSQTPWTSDINAANFSLSSLFQLNFSGYTTVFRYGIDGVLYFDASQDGYGGFTFRTVAGGGLTSRLTIANNGGVGIGTASPNSYAKLDVVGPIYTNGTGVFIQEPQSLVNSAPWYGLGNSTYGTQVGGWAGVALQTGSGRLHMPGSGNIVKVTPGVNISSYAAASQQLRICEQTETAGYGLHLGFPYINSNWHGAIQAGNAHLILQPLGGNVAIGLWSQILTNWPTMIQPNHLLSVVPGGQATFTKATQQVGIGEVSNNPGYALTLGFGPLISNKHQGLIQAWSDNVGCTMLLNTVGGWLVQRAGPLSGFDVAQMQNNTLCCMLDEGLNRLVFYVRTSAGVIKSGYTAIG